MEGGTADVTPVTHPRIVSVLFVWQRRTLANKSWTGKCGGGRLLPVNDGHGDLPGQVAASRSVFGLLVVGLLVAVLLLVLIAYFAPVDLAAEHAPKIAYGVFGFATAMLVALFVTPDGVRTPARDELLRKVPAVLVALVLCLLVLGWMRQLESLIEQSERLAGACDVVRAVPSSDAPGKSIASRQAAEG